MFDSDYTISGKHAKFLKFLAKKNSDSENAGGAKIFERYIDVYMNAAIFGLIYSKTAKRDTESKDRLNSAHILASAFINERENCMFLYRMIMLLDNSRGISTEEKINQAFCCDSQSEQLENFSKNIELFNDYVRGGIEIMYKKFTDGCFNSEDYFNRVYEVMQSFQMEMEGISDEKISELIYED